MMEEEAMECVVVCAAGAGALDGVAAAVLAVFGFAVAAALAVAVVSALAGYAWVLTLAVAVAIPPALWLLVRVWKHGPTLEVFRRHRPIVKVPARNLHKAVANERRVELPAGSSLRALEAPKVVPGEVLTGPVRERMKA